MVYLIVMLSLGFAVTSAQAQTDDHGDTAASATLLPANTLLPGVLNSPSDVDYFRFTLSALSSVTITTQNLVGAHGSLRDSNNVEIVSQSESTLPTVFFVRRELAAGTYYIRVTGAGGVTGAYAVRTTVVPLSVADLSVSRLAVAYGGLASRTFTSFAFNLSNAGPSALTNEAVLVEAFVSNQAAFGSSSDIKIGDLTLTQTLAATASVTVTLNSSQISSLTRLWPTNLAAGTYSIVVRVSFLPGAAEDRNLTNNLDFIFGLIKYGADDHGNTTATATPVALNSTTNGTLSVSGDLDYFSFTLSSAMRVTVSATGTLVIVGSLLDGGGTVIATVGGNFIPFTVTRDLPPGTYYVRVEGASGTQGDYALRVEATAPVLADLALSNLAVVLAYPQNLTFSQIAFTLANTGPTALSAVKVRFDFYLSANTTFGDGDDVKIGGVDQTLTLGAGASQTITLGAAEAAMVTSTPLPTPPVGDYYVFARATITDGSPLDLTPANNTARTSTTITFAAELTDLVAAGIVVTPLAVDRRQFDSCTVTLANHGPLPMKETPVNVEFYLSTTPTLTATGSFRIGDIYLALTLAPGASTEYRLGETDLTRLTWSWTSAIVPDAYHIIMVARIAGGIRPGELDLSNNTVASAARFTYALPPPDDHGHTATLATAVALNSATAGVLGNATDFDFFRVEVPSRARIVFTTKGAVATTGMLFDSKNQIIAVAENGGEGANFLIGRELAAGTYFLRVAGASGATGAYTFHVETAGAATVDLALTQVIVTPTTLTTRSFGGGSFLVRNKGPGAVDDENVRLDFYLSTKATFSEAEAVKIGDAQVRLSLISGDTTIGLSGAALDSATRLWPATLPGGTYYLFARLSVSDGSPSDPDPSNNLVRMSEAMVYNPPGVDDHGNSAASASEIDFQGSIAGILDSAGDVDCFQFTVPSAQRVVIFTTGDADTTGSLSNASDGLLATADNNGADLNFRIERDLFAGTYYVRVRNAKTSAGAYTLYIGSTRARLANLSIRTQAGEDAQTLIVGFNVAGQGAKPLLLRGVGPTLAAFGVSGSLADPELRLFQGETGVAANNDWGGNAAVSAVANRVGAFTLPAASRDAVLLETLEVGSYTAQIGGGTGIALVELYDAVVDGGPKLINVSARSEVGLGGNILIAGFSITGTGTKTVLIRAIGPTLAGFGVGGALLDPRLDVLNGAGQSVANNDNWGGGAALVTAFTRTGAFPLVATSRDAALLLTLSAGTYSAQVSGVNATTGVALVEIYDVP